MTLTYGPKLSLEQFKYFYIPVERMGPGSKQEPYKGDRSVSLLRWNNMARQGGLSTPRGPLPVVMDTPMTYRRPEPITGLARCLMQGHAPL